MTEFSDLFDTIKDTLAPRERDVIRLRFGFDDGRPRVLEEVGQLFGITREEVKKIEMSALMKISSALNMSPEEFFSFLEKHLEQVNEEQEKKMQEWTKKNSENFRPLSDSDKELLNIDFDEEPENK